MKLNAKDRITFSITFAAELHCLRSVFWVTIPMKKSSKLIVFQTSFELTVVAKEPLESSQQVVSWPPEYQIKYQLMDRAGIKSET